MKRKNHKPPYQQEGRLTLYLGEATKNALLEFAAAAGESMNGYAKGAIRRRVNYDKRRTRWHRACGGGIEYAGRERIDGRPFFRCTKCGETWTHGIDGGPWAGLVPKEETE